MKYVSLIAAVLTLLFMLSVPAYVTDHIVLDPMVEDIPDWALTPAQDPDDADDTGDTGDTSDDPVTPVLPTDPITVRDEDGNIIYQDDGTVTDDPTAEEPVEEPVEETPTEGAGQFLTKLFEEYTVTEGFLLLFLILGFCLVVWKIVKGVL